MKKRRYSEEQIAFALRQAEGGTPIVECRKMAEGDRLGQPGAGGEEGQPAGRNWRRTKLPELDVLAQEIADDVQTALNQFAAIAGELTM